MSAKIISLAERVRMLEDIEGQAMSAKLQASIVLYELCRASGVRERDVKKVLRAFAELSAEDKAHLAEGLGGWR